MEGSDGVARLLLKRRRKFDGPVRAEVTQGRGRLLTACDYRRTFFLEGGSHISQAFSLNKHSVPTPLEKHQVSVQQLCFMVPRSVSVSVESKEESKRQGCRTFWFCCGFK